MSIDWPWNTIAPASGRIVPVATFMSVDLPAPFSPSRACTSPGSTSSETSVRAATPPKLLEMPDMASVATTVGASAVSVFTVASLCGWRFNGVVGLPGRQLMLRPGRPVVRSRYLSSAAWSSADIWADR